MNVRTFIGVVLITMVSSVGLAEPVSTMIVTVDGKDLLCFSTVCAYSDELLKALCCRGGKEGWYWLLEQKRSK